MHYPDRPNDDYPHAKIVTAWFFAVYFAGLVGIAVFA